MAEIYAAQIEGVPDAGGSYAAIPPIVLAGASTAFPHVPWSDEPFVADEAVALELAGARARYHVPLTRTMYLGTPPATVAALADVTGEGLDAALATMRTYAVRRLPVVDTLDRLEGLLSLDEVVLASHLLADIRPGAPVHAEVVETMQAILRPAAALVEVPVGVAG